MLPDMCGHGTDQLCEVVGSWGLKCGAGAGPGSTATRSGSTSPGLAATGRLLSVKSLIQIAPPPSLQSRQFHCLSCCPDLLPQGPTGPLAPLKKV